MNDHSFIFNDAVFPAFSWLQNERTIIHFKPTKGGLVMLHRILRIAYRAAESIQSATAARRALRAEYRAYVERRMTRLEQLLATI